MSSEYESILEAARRTSDMLGLTGFSPTDVSWQKFEHSRTDEDRFYFGRPRGKGGPVVTAHFPALEGAKLIISPILQGRVAAEDWGPILAPSLVFYKRLKKGYNVGALIRVLPGLLFFFGFLAFAYLTMLQPSVELVLDIIVGVIVLVLLGAYSGIQLSRNLVLRADKEAALVIGSQSLIEALRTLEVLREHDASQGHDWPEFGDHPSITKRIANLQNS